VKVLKIATLDKGYADPMEVVLHACFQCLVDFIEKEKPETLDWTWSETHSHAWAEIQSLYRWWKDERPNRKFPTEDMDGPPISELFVEIPGSEYSRLVEPRDKYPEYYKALDEDIILDREWGEEDQRNLHRLIDVREFLWT